MTQEKFNQRLDTLRELGCEANIAILGYSEEKEQLVIFIPSEEGDSLTEMSSKLAKIFKTVLSSTEQQEDKRLFEVLSNAFASAALPYINGLREQELTSLALLGV